VDAPERDYTGKILKKELAILSGDGRIQARSLTSVLVIRAPERERDRQSRYSRYYGLLQRDCHQHVYERQFSMRDYKLSSSFE